DRRPQRRRAAPEETLPFRRAIRYGTAESLGYEKEAARQGQPLHVDPERSGVSALGRNVLVVVRARGLAGPGHAGTGGNRGERERHAFRRSRTGYRDDAAGARDRRHVRGRGRRDVDAIARV